MKSAIILAGGFSRRFGQDKGLVKLNNKFFIQHILDEIKEFVDETFLVFSSTKQFERYSKIFVNSNITFLVDKIDLKGPLVGLFTGCERALSEYVLLLPCDVPLICREVFSFLFESCTGRQAAIPRWPNGYLEPLEAVYRRKDVQETAEILLKKGRTDLLAMINKLTDIEYVPVDNLKKFDPDLKTFLNVNNVNDFEKVLQVYNKKF